ncbi:hypothetical protein EJ05DRAFT_496659 [Pseudovirgaria hyperparasitica]|uniref:tRNA-splicing endonuclease subunit Sen54 N-terminal domain-containing protein n=1 Tax=Pseudovirgaria hyperparasitica TaxID=470096 RepID=A0A6A6WI80_9PEZI|nr:uncharacterized protein EJ05DRAFT_496659 [Pseudovirgaria hyperparasitica]KAF2761760.1 hypothetical protein EJ05DRAFT_496659 [Pseudovirgaria hyperparasitica]
MADIDEDTMELPGAVNGDIDLSDETQDFRFLNVLNFTGGTDVKIPKRGEKDFEPHKTSLQSSTLAASREAMHNALSTPRVHKPKAHQIAVYDPHSNMAHIEHTKGSYTASMGIHKAGKLWLLPEEALHLLERGDLDVRWTVHEDTHEVNDRTHESGGIPMSLQGAYAAFIGMERAEGRRLTLEMYTVYSALKRGGYTVMRSEDWSDTRPPIDTSCAPKNGTSFLLNTWLGRLFFGSSPVPSEGYAVGPLVRPGLYRSYKDIYRLLNIVSTHNPTAPPSFSLPSDIENPFRLTYNVWKPNSNFKKRAPPPPDFRICVIDARNTPVPTLSQLNDLIVTTPYDPPQKDKSLEQSMKHGHRNVVLAVVDQVNGAEREAEDVDVDEDDEPPLLSVYIARRYGELRCNFRVTGINLNRVTPINLGPIHK